MQRAHLKVEKTFFDEMSHRASRSPGEVVMVIRRPGDKILLMTKEFYPDKIYRLPSGKLKPHEEPESAFSREVLEETGFHIRSDVTMDILECVFHSDSKSVTFRSYIAVTEGISGRPEPQDESESITAFREIEPCELHDVAKQLESLSEPWRDWGRWRAVAHEYLFRKMCE